MVRKIEDISLIEMEDDPMRGSAKHPRKKPYRLSGGTHVMAMKIGVIALNAGFVIIGVALLAGGLFIALGANATLAGIVNSTLSTIPLLPSQLNIVDTASNVTGGFSIDLAAVLEGVYITLCVLGALILIIALLGCSGACCVTELVFWIYVTVTGLLWIVQFMLVVLLGSGALNESIKSYLKSILIDEYKGIDDYSIYGLALNYIMIEFQCCGVDSWKEFNNSTSWDNVRSMSVAGGSGNASVDITLTTPIACCLLSGTFPNVQMPDVSCAISPSFSNSNYYKGCFEELEIYLSPYALGIYGGVAVVLLFEICIIWVSATTHFILERYEVGDTAVAIYA